MERECVAKFRRGERVRVIAGESPYFGEVGVVLGLGQLMNHDEAGEVCYVSKARWTVSFGQEEMDFFHDDEIEPSPAEDWKHERI
jgi:hypothetical protein